MKFKAIFKVIIMKQQKVIQNFNKKSILEAHIKKAEAMVLPILRQDNESMKKIWQQINIDMKKGFEYLAIELEFNSFKSVFLKLYWWYISRLMVNDAKKGKSLLEIEIRLAKLIETLFKNENVKLPYQRARAQRSYKKIKSNLIGNSVLDLGCGDGMLLKILNQSFDALGIDVIDYRSKENKFLPFANYSEGGIIDLPDKCVDNTILWTVLHHSDNPIHLLNEAERITRHRIVLVEGYANDPHVHQINCFFDWFANRPGKNIDVNVPYNFKTTEEWKSLFNKLGCKLIKEEYLGVDEPVVPERHVLFIIEPDM